MLLQFLQKNESIHAKMEYDPYVNRQKLLKYVINVKKLQVSTDCCLIRQMKKLIDTCGKTCGNCA